MEHKEGAGSLSKFVTFDSNAISEVDTSDVLKISSNSRKFIYMIEYTIRKKQWARQQNKILTRHYYLIKKTMDTHVQTFQVPSSDRPEQVRVYILTLIRHGDNA